MQQVIVLLFVVAFGNGDVTSHSTVQPTMELCERNHTILLGQTPDVYAKSDVVSIYAECLTMVLRKVKEQ